MADWITILVVSLVFLGFGAIMYKGLKEPVDAMITGLKKVWGYITDKAVEKKDSTVEVIRYD